MSTGSSPRPASPSGVSPASSDWPAQAADTIERVVGSVRDKTTGPAITLARGIVYGTFALVVGTIVAVLLAISFVRIVNVYLPDAWVGEDHTWAAHLVVGAVFSALGMALWSRRSRRPEHD
ncbi:MAG: hypothetical protein ACT452_18780 [Microthrixaceae bacterium]